MDQFKDTHRTRMEHLSLSATTIVSKNLEISSAQLYDKIIAHANQYNASIAIREHSDQEFTFRNWKSSKNISVDFGRNADEKIGMNPLRTIGISHPQMTRTTLNNCDIFDLVRRQLGISYRGLVWHGKMKSESENLRGNKIFENAERQNNFKV